MKLTNDVAKALTLPPGKTDHIVWDPSLPGFGARVRNGSKRTWVVQYRIAGRQRRESLGDVRRVLIEDARKAARKRFAQVDLGVDPGAEREVAAAAQLTLGVAADRYIEAREAVRRPSTMKAIRLHLR